MLVDFLLVGAQKSGTTTLHAYLNEHPQIQMAKKKELHFFNNETFFLDQSVNYNKYYHSWFEQNSDHQYDKNLLKGEATPAYLYCRNAATRIWQYNPAMKIIIILRNPIERAFSHWNMEHNRGADPLSFENALRQEETRCQKALPLQHYIYSYVDRGFYTSQIREYWRCFGENQVLILKYDQLRENPALIVQKLFAFLDIDATFTKNSIKDKEKFLHKANYTSTMSKYTYAKLIKVFEYEIRQLENMLNWDCSNWLTVV